MTHCSLTIGGIPPIIFSLHSFMIPFVRQCPAPYIQSALLPTLSPFTDFVAQKLRTEWDILGKRGLLLGGAKLVLFLCAVHFNSDCIFRRSFIPHSFY